jgi:hypothetical protein
MNKDERAYWDKRKTLNYYHKAVRIVSALHPCSLLDVGTGPTLYAGWFPATISTSILDKQSYAIWDLLPQRIARITGDFLNIRLGRYQCVTCLQCLEHIPPADMPWFARQLFYHAKSYLVVSIPYMWKGTKALGHDDLNEETLLNWLGREPALMWKVTEDTGHQRLIARYDQ